MPLDPLLLVGLVILVVVAVVVVMRQRQSGITTVSSAPQGQTRPLQPDVPADLNAAVQQWLANGNKIEAIKLVRERTGMGLKEAKDYVEALEAGRPVALPISTNTAPAVAGDLNEEIRQVLASGSKIEAIKLVRERTGMGLKEAKDYVEALEAGRSVPLPTSMSAPAPAASGDLPEQVRSMLAKNQKIQAIKLVREQTGWGLKEAKDYVETLE